MEFPTFTEWLARRDEGLLLPDRPPLKGPFAPTVRKVKEIVPNKFVARLNSLPIVRQPTYLLLAAST